jgi:N-methylhydantoinase A
MPVTIRKVYFGTHWHDTPVYRRDSIPAGVKVPGPVVLEQLDSTTVVAPGQVCRHDELGFLHIIEETS